MKRLRGHLNDPFSSLFECLRPTVRRTESKISKNNFFEEMAHASAPDDEEITHGVEQCFA